MSKTGVTRPGALTTALLVGALVAACSEGEPAADRPAQASSPSGAASPSGSALRSTSPRPTPAATPKPTSKPEAPVATGWGPTAAEIAKARRLVGGLSLEQKAGQVIVAAYDGTAAPTDLVNDLHLGGVIVMAENVAGTDDVRRNNRALQDAATKVGRGWPVFVGVDQEGGIVERVKGAATRFPTFMTYGAARRPDLTARAAAASGAELVDLGFTVVFAPVADVTSGPEDPTIGSRSVGWSPDLVAIHANAAADGYLASGILPVLKHFPGHGSVPADSHLELPMQTRSLPELLATDLVPFQAAVAEGTPAVMVAHIDVRAVAPGDPSTVQPKIVDGLLRKRLGFRGLVVTDALNMQAISERYGSAETAVGALRAGNDVLLMPPDPRAARDGIVAAVRADRLSGARLDQAATRQVATLLHQRSVAAGKRARAPGTSLAVARQASAAGITSVSGPCSGRLVGGAVVATGPDDAVAAFNAAAAGAGLAVGSGTSVALVGFGGGPASADVVVSLDTPYVLGRSSARSRIALYGDTPGAMSALVDVLTGEARAPGTLPVPVAGVPRAGC